jgi:steroid 5-alpha reductase family enzyme
MNPKQTDLFQITVIYVALALVGAVTAEIATGALIFQAGLADFVMTIVIFAASLWKKNSSAYDAYWSVIPSLLTVWLLVKCDGLNWHGWQWATFMLVNVWSWRLTLSWARGWPGWHHEDWRYVDLRAQHGRRYPLINFLGIHLFPTIIVFIACLGLFDVAQGQNFSTLLMSLGLAVGVIGIGLEYVADNQLAAFRHRPNPHTADLLDSGIWSVVRYPNYLGEMLFWCGVALCGLGAGGAWWVATGAVAMILLFVFISIPMKDDRMRARRTDFESYRKRVPAFIPRWR